MLPKVGSNEGGCVRELCRYAARSLRQDVRRMVCSRMMDSIVKPRSPCSHSELQYVIFSELLVERRQSYGIPAANAVVHFLKLVHGVLHVPSGAVSSRRVLDRDNRRAQGNAHSRASLISRKSAPRGTGIALDGGTENVIVPGMSDEQRRERVEAAVRALHRASAILDPIRLRLWDSQGLTVTQLRLLFHVADSDGISNAELAAKLYVTRPSVSALLDRLERNGFITREIDRDDRRGIRILLQDRGREALSSVSNLPIYSRGLLDSVDDVALDAMVVAIDALEASRNRLTVDEMDDLTKKATS